MLTQVRSRASTYTYVRAHTHTHTHTNTHTHMQGNKQVPSVPLVGDLEYEDDEEMSRHEDLMDTILEEEEQLITAHRMQVRKKEGRGERRERERERERLSFKRFVQTEGL